MLKQILPYSEFVHHIANHNLNPWGDDWAQAGQQAWATLSAPHLKYRKSKPDDYVPRRRMRLKPRQSVSQMKAILFGGTRKLEEMRSGR